MVQILPPRVSLGQQLGMATGQGLQQGLSQSAQTQYNRGLLQEALGRVRESAQGQNANPLDTTLNFLEATAGIPGAEKYVGQVLPMLLNQMSLQKRTEAEAARPGMFTQLNAVDQIQQSQPEFTSSLQSNQPLYEFSRPKSGFFQTPLTNEEIKNKALSLAETNPGDPSAFERFYNTELKLNEAQKAQQAEFKNLAGSLESIQQDPSQYPLFQKIAERYSNLNDANQIFEKTKRDFYRVRNDLDAIDNIVMPFGKVIQANNIGKRMPSREDIIKQSQPFIKRLVDLGFEDEVRNKLTQQGLGPTEVNMALHPLRKDLDINARNYKGKNQKDLEKFIQSNIQSGDSILGLRDKLRSKVDWETFRDAFENVASNTSFSNNLAPWQQSERIELLNPPRDSLASLFRGFISDYFGGKK